MFVSYKTNQSKPIFFLKDKFNRWHVRLITKSRLTNYIIRTCKVATMLNEHMVKLLSLVEESKL